MKKRLIAMMLGLTMAAGCLTGCGGQKEAAPDAAGSGSEDAGESSSDADVLELEMWCWQSSINEDLVAQVEQAIPGVRVNVNKFNSENMEEKVLTALASNSPLPDILVMDDWVNNVLPSADKFYNLLDEPFSAEQYADQYVEWKWKNAMTGDGEKLIAIPIDAGPTAMYYRADLFEAAGLPTEPEEVAALMSDWDGALTAAKQMKEKTGVNMFDFVNNLFLMMISQKEEGLINRNDEFIGDQDHIKEAFYTAASFKDYVFGMPDMYGTEWGAAMNNGDVAAYCGAVWTLAMLKSTAPDTAGQWRVTKMPGGPANHGGSCMGIPLDCEHPEEAFQVITWLQNAQNQLTALETESLFPTNLEALDAPEILAEDEFFGGQKVNEIFVDAVKNVPSQYMGMNYSAFRQYFYDELMLVQDAGKDVDEAWEDAMKGCEALKGTL